MDNTSKHHNYKRLIDFTIKIVKITRITGNITLNKSLDSSEEVQIKSVSQPVSSLVTLDTYSQEELIAIVLLLGIGLYLSRSFFQGIIIKIQKRIVNYMEGNLFPHTPILKVYYDRGFFTLYWLICLLFVLMRLTEYFPLFELTGSSIGDQFFSIALSMLIALIPSLLLTVVEDLNEIISALHFKVCTTYRIYLRIILHIYVLHIYTMNNNIRAFLRFMFLFSLFAGYLFTNSTVILSLWLTIIYLGVYCEYIVSKIVDRNQIMLLTHYTMGPDKFLYYFRFPYWRNKLPYFYDEDAYERGYCFRAMHPKTFANHVEWHNSFMNSLKKNLKDMQDPRYVYALLSMGLKSMDAMNIKQEKSIKRTLKIVKKRILKEYPHSKTIIEVRPEDVITVQHEMTPEGLKFKNRYGHPNAFEYGYMMPNSSLVLEKVYPVQHAEFVIGKDGVVRPYGETAQKVAQKVSTGDLTKKL